MKKSNTPFGLSLSPEFKEVVNRLEDKEAEFDAVIEKDGELDPDRTVDHLESEEDAEDP